MSVWKHVRAIILLPGSVTIIIPVIILSSKNNSGIGCFLPASYNLLPFLSGALLVGSGILLMIRTIKLFATFGRGTLAPWDPTQRLVVHGIYRHVRNPMISGVFCVLLGEAILLGSLHLLYWFFVFVILNVIYIPAFEEHSLKRRFGDEYVLYKKNVPRWLPRIHPWKPPWDEAADKHG